MQELLTNLYVGSDDDKPGEDWACIHAAKNPWHCDAVGYKGNLPKEHPNYLMLKFDDDLYLNMIDPPFELSAEFTDPIVKECFKFIDENRDIRDRPVLVRCNKGLSRSPSIVMAYMARKMLFEGTTFKDVSEEFRIVYPDYKPGDGVAAYFSNNWDRILKFY